LTSDADALFDDESPLDVDIAELNETSQNIIFCHRKEAFTLGKFASKTPGIATVAVLA
jgi:hypothetical protein